MIVFRSGEQGVLLGVNILQCDKLDLRISNIVLGNICRRCSWKCNWIILELTLTI